MPDTQTTYDKALSNFLIACLRFHASKNELQRDTFAFTAWSVIKELHSYVGQAKLPNPEHLWLKIADHQPPVGKVLAGRWIDHDGGRFWSFAVSDVMPGKSTRLALFPIPLATHWAPLPSAPPDEG